MIVLDSLLLKIKR